MSNLEFTVCGSLHGESPGAIPQSRWLAPASLSCEALWQTELVKLLFSSSEMAEVVLVKSLLVRAGIRCEVRQQDIPAGTPELPVYPELWI